MADEINVVAAFRRALVVEPAPSTTTLVSNPARVTTTSSSINVKARARRIAGVYRNPRAKAIRGSRKEPDGRTPPTCPLRAAARGGADKLSAHFSVCTHARTAATPGSSTFSVPMGGICTFGIEVLLRWLIR